MPGARSVFWNLWQALCGPAGPDLQLTMTLGAAVSHAARVAVLEEGVESYSHFVEGKTEAQRDEVTCGAKGASGD